MQRRWGTGDGGGVPGSKAVGGGGPAGRSDGGSGDSRRWRQGLPSPVPLREG
jgi:hypothetical protein